MYPRIAESCFILHFIVLFSFFCNCYCLSSSSSLSSSFNLRLARVQLLKPKQISLSYVNFTNLFEILFLSQNNKIIPIPSDNTKQISKIIADTCGTCIAALDLVSWINNNNP